MRRLTILLSLLAVAAPGPAFAAWTPGSAVPGSRDAVVNRVALSADGTVAVAWDGSKVAIRRRGGTWERVRALATRGTSATSPDIAFDVRGRLLAVWTQSPARPGQPLTGPYQIRFRQWTLKRGWGAVRVLGRSGHFTLAQPRVATNVRGDAIVSWRGFRRSGRHVVEALASRLRIVGERFGPLRTAAAGGPYRDVALDLRGNAYGVYTTYSGPRNYFVYQPRGRGWQKPERLPGSPASKPRIAVGGDRTAAIAWREAAVDSEGNGTQAGLPWAILRLPLGGYTFPFALSSVTAADVNVVAIGAGYLLTWAAPEFTEPPDPAALDLHYALRGEGNYIGGDLTIPGARMGPSGNLPDGTALVVYGVDGAVRSVRRDQRSVAFAAPETIAARGLYPSLAVNGSRAVVTWLDPDRNRLMLARLVAIVERAKARARWP